MRVSAIIPTYGRAPSLRRVLDTLRAQTRPVDEIILVDQNAPGWLAAELGPALDGVLVQRLPAPNVSAARNHGAVHSRGDVLLFIDDDLVPEPNFVASALETLQRFPEISCLCPLIVSDDSSLDQLLAAFARKTLARHPQRPTLWSVRDTISAVMFFRREAYEASGGFDELLFGFARSGEDQELCLRMRLRGLDVWLDSALHVEHDLRVPGGCELRVKPYWDTRRLFMRSIALRARLHNRGRISPRDFVGLMRSSFLNTALLRKGPRWALRNIGLLHSAIQDTGQFVRGQPPVGDVRATEYLSRHRAQ